MQSIQGRALRPAFFLRTVVSPNIQRLGLEHSTNEFLATVQAIHAAAPCAS
jgi:hypothetical protein